MLLRANALDILAVGLEEVIFQKYAEIPVKFEQIFNVIGNNKRNNAKDTGFSGFGLLSEKPEGQELAPDDPIQGYDTTYTHVAYGLYSQVTKEMRDDDQYDVIAKMPAALATSVMRTKETYAAEPFNNGFTAAGRFLSGGDGQYLFSASHPLTGGGTYQNILTTAADLSVSSLEEALYTMRLTVGDRGELLMLEPKILLVPPQLERLAFELTKSSGRPDTANRADNWLATQGLQVVVWPYLTDTDAWFLLTDKSQHNLKFFNRIDLETDNDIDFKTKDILNSVYTRFSLGWSDFRGVFGTPGA